MFNHTSVHLKDYFPEKLDKLSNKKIKKQVDTFYTLLEFDLFKEKLRNFLNLHLK